MVDDIPYDGYRFEYSRADDSAPGGLLKVHYISVERSHEAAVTRVIAVTGGEPNDVRLLEYGPSVLAEARQRGIADGQAVAL